MSYKYASFDRKLFAWLRANRVNVTTAQAVVALGVVNHSTHIRHISRRFTQLEGRGVLKCTLHGTTRVCNVEGEIPIDMTQQHWRAGITKAVIQHLDATGRGHSVPANQPSIPANNSHEFEAAGGHIQRLPSHWDTPMIGSKPLGDSFTFDD